MAKLSDVILRGTRASQPAATAVAEGAVYYVTDEYITERSTGAAWQSIADGGTALNAMTTDRLLGRDTAGTGAVEQLQVASGIEFSGTPGIRLTTAARTKTVGFLIDDGGSVISTGLKGFISVPVAGTITAVRLLSCDASITAGAIVVDVWKDTYANYPPTVADTITAAAKPTITASNTKAEDSTLTGWTTAVAAGDILGFNVDSVTSLTRVLVQLTFVVTG